MLDSAKNFSKGTLSAGYASTDTSVVLAAGDGARFPSPPFNAVWWNSTDYPDPSDDPNVEIVRVTAIATDTLTVTRAQEGTTATAKNTSGKTYKLLAGLTAKVINDDLPTFYAVAPSSDTVAESASDTTFAASLTIPANTLKSGSSVRIIWAYSATNNSGGNWYSKPRAYANGVVIVDPNNTSSATPNGTTKTNFVNATLVMQGAGSSAGFVTSSFDSDNGAIGGGISTGTLDTTVSQTITVGLQGVPTSSSAALRNLWIEVYP